MHKYYKYTNKHTNEEHRIIELQDGTYECFLSTEQDWDFDLDGGCETCGWGGDCRWEIERHDFENLEKLEEFLYYEHSMTFGDFEEY